MKVLLINPNSSLISRSWAYKMFFTPIAPLGLAYIASFLEKEGVEVFLSDQFANKDSDEKLLGLISDVRPDIIGFSALTPVVPDVKRLAGKIRRLNPDAKLVLGNIHGTCFPEEVIEGGLADVVVRGEGEVTMLELCRRIGSKSALDGVPGISFKKDEKIVHGPDREPVADLDSLPFPAWHLINPDNYTEVPLVAINKSRAFPIMASRGCTYRCYYCSQDKIYTKVRYRELNPVVEEMEYFNRKFDIKFFGFTDAYFPWDEATGMEFCALLIKRGLHKKFKWCTETRVDKVTPVLLREMKRANAHLIMYGVEVGNEDVLKSVDKNATLDQARFAFRETRKAGILSQGLFILGLPGEKKENCFETIKFAKELDCDIVKFNIATPYPGSAFFEDYSKNGALDDPEKFTSWFDWLSQENDLVYSPEGMSNEELRNIQRRAMLEFYIRPKIILRFLLTGSISFRNFFFGGFWLVSLLVFNATDGLRGFVAKKKGKK